jgi:hypothetical protein
MSERSDEVKAMGWQLLVAIAPQYLPKMIEEIGDSSDDIEDEKINMLAKLAFIGYAEMCLVQAEAFVQTCEMDSKSLKEWLMAPKEEQNTEEAEECNEEPKSQ